MKIQQKWKQLFGTFAGENIKIRPRKLELQAIATTEFRITE